MRLLLVEDERALAEALEASLKRENYTVDLAFDGVEGLDQALTGIYDVIILDIMLPKKNGIDVLKELRAEKIATPVLMLTARSETEDKVEGLDNGADDYLTKPFQLQELLARLRAISRRKGEMEDQSLSFGDLILDTKRCVISSRETKKTMQLGQKEFQLLEYMLRNQNQIITKEQIVEKVWGFESEAEYNSAEVYVSFTRKKIKFIGSKVKIKAVRGIGYTLEEN